MQVQAGWLAGRVHEQSVHPLAQAPAPARVAVVGDPVDGRRHLEMQDENLVGWAPTRMGYFSRVQVLASWRCESPSPTFSSLSRRHKRSPITGPTMTPTKDELATGATLLLSRNSRRAFLGSACRTAAIAVAL